MSILAMPQLWIGAGLFLIAAFFLFGRDADKKKARARLERITRKAAPKLAISAESLRRRDPNAGSALGQRLAGINSIEKLRGRLDMAGLAITPQRLLTYCAGLFVLVLLFTLLLGKPILLGILVALVVSLGLPHLIIKRK
jgi:Flp pilus assembly protein TadB